MIETETAAAGQADCPGRWGLVVVLMLIYSYGFVDRVVLALLVDPIKHDLHASDFEMSLLLGLAFALFYGIFSLPSGHFADRTNRLRLIAVASLGWALMTIVCGTATTLTQLFVGRAGVGLMEAAMTPAAYSLIRDVVPAKSRGLAFSTYALAPVLGSAVSLALGGLLLRTAVAGAFAGLPVLGHLAPWQSTLVIVGLAGMPLSLLLLLFAEPQRAHWAGDAAGGVVAGLAEAARFIGRNRALYGPLLVFAGVGAMMSFSYAVWFPAAFGRRYGLLPQQLAPTLGAISLIAGAGGLLFGGWMMNRLTRGGASVMSYSLIALIGTAVGVAGACLAPNSAVAFVSAAIGIFFLGISNPAGATVVGQTTPAAMVGRVSAFYLLVQTLIGQTLGPLGVALAGKHLFNGASAIGYGVALVEVSCGVIASLCAVLLIRRHRRRIIPVD